MDPREFQTLASQLIDNQSPSHAALRTAVSRSYFAVYLAGFQILRGMSITLPKGSEAHQRVRIYLHNSGDKEVEGVGSQLSILQGQRVDADYHLRYLGIENAKTVETIVTKAKQMIETLDRCCFGQNRNQIIAKVKAYEALIEGRPTIRHS